MKEIMSINTDLLSPTIPTSILTFLPISRGSMSTWMIFCWGGVGIIGGLPSPSHDEKRQPTARITSASRRDCRTASPPSQPPSPKNREWFTGKLPEPMGVVVAAAPSVSARVWNSSQAREAITPPPARRRGLLASRSICVAFSMSSGSPLSRPIGR